MTEKKYELDDLSFYEKAGILEKRFQTVKMIYERQSRNFLSNPNEKNLNSLIDSAKKIKDAEKIRQKHAGNTRVKVDVN